MLIAAVVLLLGSLYGLLAWLGAEEKDADRDAWEDIRCGLSGEAEGGEAATRVLIRDTMRCLRKKGCEL